MYVLGSDSNWFWLCENVLFLRPRGVAHLNRPWVNWRGSGRSHLRCDRIDSLLRLSLWNWTFFDDLLCTPVQTKQRTTVRTREGHMQTQTVFSSLRGTCTKFRRIRSAWHVWESNADVLPFIKNMQCNATYICISIYIYNIKSMFTYVRKLDGGQFI